MKSLLMILLLTFSTIAFADGTSSSNRSDKTFQFTGSFLGREYVAFGVLTASLGYYMTPDDLLIVRYSNFNGSYSSGKNETLRAATLGYRHFFANSFNIMPTAYYRRNTKEGDFSFFNNTKSKIAYEDAGIGFRIGNEWQWSTFTMGCDWFGVNRTVKKFHDEKTGGSWDDFDLERRYTFTLVSFYLGVAF